MALLQRLHQVVIVLVLTISVIVTSEGSILDEAQTQKLHEGEQVLVDNLENHLKRLDLQLSAMDWFKENFYANHDIISENDVEEYVSNPINTYVMIQRLTNALPQVLMQLQDSKTSKEWEDILADIDNNLNIDPNEATEIMKLLAEENDINDGDTAKLQVK